jgi:hypothetical protein
VTARLLLVLLLAGGAFAADLQTAEQLAWAKRFAESEAMYRELLSADPQSHAAQLGLARVVLWQGRYREAIQLFSRLDGVDALEGRATAEYWSGDVRQAARHFREVLALDPSRQTASSALRDIEAAARPSQRLTIEGVHDDQPLDAVRTEASASFFSDPGTQWTFTGGAYRIDAARRGTHDGHYAVLGNETRVAGFTAGATLGIFRYPDGVQRPIGSIRLRHRSLELRVAQAEELASATSVTTHTSSLTTTLRWSHDKSWIGAAELSHKRYSDANEGRALVAYAAFPSKHGAWTLWGGASVSARDTDDSRFRMTAVSSTSEPGLFRYQYRGEYDPYWTPDQLLEGRFVLAIERAVPRGTVKLHADAGYARDYGRAFGPDAGSSPFPSSTYSFDFARSDRPWRAGLTVDLRLAPQWRLETRIERSVTIDYRSTFFHVALARRS